MELELKYQQMTDKQHILEKPDTYMGSIELVSSKAWIFNEETQKIEEKTIEYIPGFFKLVDEAIVNCRDHVERMKTALEVEGTKKYPVTEISVNVEPDGTIVMVNNGNGIDVVLHPTYNVWIPEMIFAQLRSSTNYTKEKTIIGGKNGYGVKIVFIWSTECSIETVDHIRGKKYVQNFSNNLDIIQPPTITSSKSKPYTAIRFKPDYARFGIEGITPDVLQLFKKRVYDIAAVTDKSVKLKWNNQPIPVKSFSQYIDLYIAKEVRIYEEGGDRWEFAVALSSTHEFVQVSFVNGISTSKGGKHVEYILGQIVKKLCDYIEKKKKTRVSPNSIKEQLILFLRCDIENPSFDSQTKDFMNTPSSKFGSTCVVSDKFIEKVAKLGVMDTACSITELKENKQIKKTDGAKTKNIRGIPKLIDANWAGTEKSSQCSIIICEGDSAKAGIVSGTNSTDRNTIGIYPLKGKMLNVRGEDMKRVAENKEITEFKKILGLETGKTYTIEDVHKHLRYGQVWILCDQDNDGSHIKGLCINMFHTLWPSLVQIPHFINFMNTPIIKSTKGATQLSFYNENEFRLWKENMPAGNWKIKYYKGLGTSNREEFQEYLKTRKLVGFEHSESCDETIDMIFNKKRAEDRKGWLADYDRTSCLDTSHTKVTYTDFIHKEFKHFSNADNDRSIPSMVDGLKESQRKVIYGAFKRNLVNECKVSQISGYISEHSCYHHGEMSLNQTIVGMAQDFVGSNNINLLMPNGQFGTRLRGGKDAASVRYIFTSLNSVTRKIFPLEDDNVLHYLEDDGTPVEPSFYVPIIPMVLVNGAKGIGTGYSTEVLCYNPLEIIEYIKDSLTSGVPEKEFVPYYNGFIGTIEKLNEMRFTVKGIYNVLGKDKIEITELPVGTWTDDYKEFLESLTDTVDKNGNKIAPLVKDYDDLCKDISVHFVITLHKGKLEELQAKEGIEKVFRLSTTLSTNNMHLFNEEDKLVKYTRVNDIIDGFMVTRLSTYQKRKNYIIEKLSAEILFMENRVNFLNEILEGTIVLMKKKTDEVNTMLEAKGYSKLGESQDYKYLTRMFMDSVTEENIEKRRSELFQKKKELETIQNTSIETSWLRELVILEEHIKPKKIEKVKGKGKIKIIV